VQVHDEVQEEDKEEDEEQEVLLLPSGLKACFSCPTCQILFLILILLLIFLLHLHRILILLLHSICSLTSAAGR